MERYVNPTRYEVDDRGCWIWQLSVFPTGYGRAVRRGRTLLAHRVSYEEHVGPIPEGLTLDHLCEVHRCVNPAHLEAVSLVENIRRGRGWAGVNARKTECNRGHEYTPENTLTNRGRRRCRTCRDQHNRNRYLRKEKQP